MYEVSLFMLYLAVYSFLGWVAEELFVLATTQKLENRGFLTGPFLPIYGIGAILILLLIEPFVANPFLAFVASVVITSTLEFFTHLFLDKVFHISLWDYHDERFNLQGRICLRNSLAFGLLSLLLLYVLNPFFTDLFAQLSPEVVIAIAWSLIGILLVDATNSILSLAKIRPQLDAAKGTLAELHTKIESEAVRLHAETGAFQRANVQRLHRAFPRARSTRKA